MSQHCFIMSTYQKTKQIDPYCSYHHYLFKYHVSLSLHPAAASLMMGQHVSLSRWQSLTNKVTMDFVLNTPHIHVIKDASCQLLVVIVPGLKIRYVHCIAFYEHKLQHLILFVWCSCYPRQAIIVCSSGNLHKTKAVVCQKSCDLIDSYIKTQFFFNFHAVDTV